MKNSILVSLIFLFFLSSSCAKKIYVNFQSDSANTGTVVLKPSKPTSRTFATINDKLIVDKKSVKSITIKNVPNGDYNIRYTSENGWYKDKLDYNVDLKMEDKKEITKLVEVPPYSTGYWVYCGLVFVGTMALWLVIL